MRYLVFGDVHSNYEALDAVLATGAGLAVEGYLFLGDLVGYGPSPRECVTRLRALQQAGRLAWVAGNHERVVRGELAGELGYSEEAERTLAWTRLVLAAEPELMAFLGSAPLFMQVNEGIWLTHDSLAAPGEAGYHRWPQNARGELARLRGFGGRVCFYGHTHRLRAEILAEETDLVLVPMEPVTPPGRDPHPLQLAANALAWIGTGSVGLPVSPGHRAEFLVLDDAAWTVERYAVDYPRARTRELVRERLTAPCGAPVAEQIARWL